MWLKQTLMTAFINRRTLSTKDVKDIVEKAHPENLDPASVNLSELIDDLRGTLHAVDMDIARVTDQFADQRVFVLINRSAGAIGSQLATELNALQVEYIRAFISAIFGDDSAPDKFHLTLSEVSEVNPNRSFTAVDKLLDSLVAEGWFHVNDGKYTLSTRALAELHDYLKLEFEDRLQNCHACLQIVTYGKRCEYCSAYFHSMCLERAFKVRDNESCPKCNTNAATFVVVE